MNSRHRKDKRNFFQSLWNTLKAKRLKDVSLGSLMILFSILLLGFSLRYYHYTSLPRHGATFDEFAWTWLGINIIQEHIPVSWSSQPQYTNKEHLIYQGAAFWIVRPYLEHPPLFGLVAGSSALLNGANDMYSVTLGNMRKLSLLLGVFSIVMVFLFVRSVYGEKMAFLSSLLYATVPTVVIGSRIVQNENFMIPFWLLSLLMIWYYFKSEKKRYRNIAAVIAGLLTLAKVPWIVVCGSLVLLLFSQNKIRDGFIVAGITLAIFSTFLIYGLIVDSTLFVNLWMLQLARYDITFTGFFSIFTDPLLVDRYYIDGWILFGWISILFLLKNIKEHFMIVIPFLSYFLIYVFAIPDEPAHGWYRYPFYPFLIISISLFLASEWKRFTPGSLLFILIVGFALLGTGWYPVFGFSYLLYRVFILLVAVPAMYIVWKNYSGFFPKAFLSFWFISFILFNIFSVLLYSE